MNQFIILAVILAIVAAAPTPQSTSYVITTDAQPYSFSWSVLDKPSFQEYSHTQSSDGKVTTGFYHVYLPDGRVQTVNYRADENGYKADVKYETFSKTGTWIPSAIAFRVFSRL
uniref:Cuticle protein n=1 Tax=Daphnia galeata TaxID=27404 RepID=A0A8J2WF39_9CRUS|nr:unnamed protein product [Daphnia galeata]